MPTAKLSDAQRRALQAAADGQLAYDLTLMGKPDFWVRDVTPMSKATVRATTVQRLVADGLLATPDLPAKRVDITAAGRRALAA